MLKCNVLGINLTYRQDKYGNIEVLKKDKVIVTISQNALKRYGKSGLIGIAQTYGYRSLKYKVLYGLSRIIKQDIGGNWII